MKVKDNSNQIKQYKRTTICVVIKYIMSLIYIALALATIVFLTVFIKEIIVADNVVDVANNITEFFSILFS